MIEPEIPPDRMNAIADEIAELIVRRISEEFARLYLRELFEDERGPTNSTGPK